MVEQVKVTESAFELASRIIAAGGDKHYIDLNPTWRGKVLAELIQKKVAQRKGHGKGQFGAPGSVRVLVPANKLGRVASRAPRKKSVDEAGALGTKTAATSEVLQFGALERFVSDFKARVVELMGPRKKEADEKVAQAKKDVAAANDEHAEWAAVRKLQDALDERTRLASAVEREVARTHKRGEYSDALTPVVNAMLGSERP
jgi:hypothetical protein